MLNEKKKKKKKKGVKVLWKVSGLIVFPNGNFLRTFSDRKALYSTVLFGVIIRV